MRTVIVVLSVFAFILCIHPYLHALEKTTVAIGIFEVKNVDGTDANMIEDLFRNDLAKVPFLDVVNKKEMIAILEEQAFQQKGFTETEQAVELGRVLNVKIYISGTVMKFGNNIVVDIIATDVQSGVIKTSVRKVLKATSEFLNVSMDLANEISYLLSGNKVIKIVVKPPTANIITKADVISRKAGIDKAEFLVIFEGETLEATLTAPDYDDYHFKQPVVTSRLNQFEAALVWQYAQITISYQRLFSPPSEMSYKNITHEQYTKIVLYELAGYTEPEEDRFAVMINEKKQKGNSTVIAPLSPGTYMLVFSSPDLQTTEKKYTVALQKNDKHVLPVKYVFKKEYILRMLEFLKIKDVKK